MSTAALAADALAGRQAPEVAPAGRTAPQVAAPPRRRRLPGSTTEALPVRACSGEALGRHGAAARRTTEAPALRLTRRGRMLVTALSVLVFGSAIVVLGLRVAGVLEPGPDFSHTVPVQVAPGQTLWSIAQDTNPTQDPATVVEKIADLNKLSSPADVVPGQTLQIPVAR
jgi:LysM repeat protein